MKWIKMLFYVFFIYAAVTASALMNGLRIDTVFEPTALIFVFAGWIFIFANYSLSEVIQSFGQASGMVDSGRQSVAMSQQIIATIGNYGLLAAGTMNLMIIFHALGSMDDPQALGIAFAVSLRPLAWALAAKVFIGIPLQNNLRHLKAEV